MSSLSKKKKDKFRGPLDIAIDNTKYAIRLLKNNINRNNKKLQLAEEGKREQYALNVEKYEKELVKAEKDLEFFLREKEDDDLLYKAASETIEKFNQMTLKPKQGGGSPGQGPNNRIGIPAGKCTGPGHGEPCPKNMKYNEETKLDFARPSTCKACRSLYMTRRSLDPSVKNKRNETLLENRLAKKGIPGIF